GSLWAGVAMPDGRIVVGGLLGSLFQSSDGGTTWSPLKAETKNSITNLVATGKGLVAVGLDGLVLTQRAGGAPLEVSQRPDRAALTATVIDARGKPILFSQDGVLSTP
ncbi:beta propeller repeat protein, partial [Pandoraea terrae]